MRNTNRLVSFVVGCTVCAAACLGCTVIRYRDPPDAGGGGPVVEVPPPVVDMLVLVEVDPSAANLAPAFDQLVGSVRSALGRAGVEVRNVGLAPLRHRVGDAVPLIAGGDAASFALHGPMLAYTTGELAAFLEERTQDEHSNLIELGANLDVTPLYEPSPDAPDGGPRTGEAFFGPPADGWVVLTLTGLAARCGAGGDADCAVVAAEHAAALLATDPESGNAAWLSFPGGAGLPVARIFHLFAAPPEVGSSYVALSDACTARPNFQVAALDSIQPSEVYRSDVAQRVSAGGVRAEWLDLCGLLSRDGPSMIERSAQGIAAALVSR